MSLDKVPKLSPQVKVLMYLFGFVYFSQGIAQFSGLMSQPLTFYFKEVLGFAADEATNYLAVLTIPWVIKPLYGLISDFVPLLGYRRKSWLIAMNGMAAIAFLWLTGLTEANQIVLAMTITAIGTAASDVIIDALMVEKGQKYGITERIQSTQWLWFNIAAIGTSLLGGWLIDSLGAESALRTAAFITMVAPAAVVVSVWFLLKEEKVKMNKAQVSGTVQGLWQSVRNLTLWAVMFFIIFWEFSPSLGTPFFYHMIDNLGFTQKFIGTLGAVGSVGSVAGAWLYGFYFSRKTLRFQLVFSIITGTIGTLAYLMLMEPSALAGEIALGLSMVFGATGMIATLTVLTLAAQVCPPKAEGFTFSVLMSVKNGAAQLSAILGAWLFVNVFANTLTPLVWVSALATLSCLVLLPLLRGVKDSHGVNNEDEDTPST